MRCKVVAVDDAFAAAVGRNLRFGKERPAEYCCCLFYDCGPAVPTLCFLFQIFKVFLKRRPARQALEDVF